MTPGSAAPRVGIVFRPQLLPPERLPGFATAAEAGGYGDLWLWEDCFCEGGLTTAADRAGRDRLDPRRASA